MSGNVSNFLKYFEYDFFLYTLLAAILISLICGLLSPLVVLKQRAYIGDTLIHVVFPGIVVGYFASEYFDMSFWLSIFLAASVTALIGIGMIEWFLRVLKIPSDSSAVISLTAFLSFGILFLSQIKGTRIDPESILFGDILSVDSSDVFVLAFVFIFILSLMFFLKKDWNAWLADPEFAELAGYRIKLLNVLFPILMTVAALVGVFTVGGLMISALLTLPAVLCSPKRAISLHVILISLSYVIVGLLMAFFFSLPIGPSVVILGLVFVILKTLFIQFKSR